MIETATGAPSLRLAEWAKRSGTSALQTMLSVGTRPGTISLALGLPAPELFPAAAYGSAAAAVLAENPVALQYSPPHAPLQTQVAELMAQRGVAFAPERSVQDAVKVMAQHDIGSLVIMDRGRMAGMLTFAEVLKALGPNGYLINVARGSVVDESALIEALQQGVIAGAGLDVFEKEPQVPEALRALDNVVLTPHMASATWQTRQAMADLAVDNLKAPSAGRPLLSPVPECS